MYTYLYIHIYIHIPGPWSGLGPSSGTSQGCGAGFKASGPVGAVVRFMPFGADERSHQVTDPFCLGWEIVILVCEPKLSKGLPETPTTKSKLNGAPRALQPQALKIQAPDRSVIRPNTPTLIML